MSQRGRKIARSRVRPRGAVGAVGIHADGHPLLTVDKPRAAVRVWRGHAPRRVSARVWDRRNSGTEMDGKGMAARRSWAYIRMPAARFANTRPRVSALVPTGNQTVFRAYIFPFFSFSRPRNFYVRFEYTMCIPLYNTFFDSFRDRGTKREFEKKKRFELDKVKKKKKENIFLLLFSIPLP